MDNASKALIMAGAVLIAILLISLTFYTVSQLRAFSAASSTQALAEQREAFNRFFVYSEPSAGAAIKGSDMYNIICKAIDINQGWSTDKIEIVYFGTDYSNKSQEEIKVMFTANDKELLKREDIYYSYSLSTTTGAVNRVEFTD